MLVGVRTQVEGHVKVRLAAMSQRNTGSEEKDVE